MQDSACGIYRIIQLEIMYRQTGLGTFMKRLKDFILSYRDSKSMMPRLLLLLLPTFCSATIWAPPPTPHGSIRSPYTPRRLQPTDFMNSYSSRYRQRPEDYNNDYMIPGLSSNYNRDLIKLISSICRACKNSAQYGKT